MSQQKIPSPYHTQLPWSEESNSLRRFIIICALFILLFILIAWKIQHTFIPYVKKKTIDKLPDRLVELVAEKTKRPEPPPVKIKPKPKPEEPKPIEEKQSIPVEKDKPKEVVKETEINKPVKVEKPQYTEQEIQEAHQVATQVFEEQVGSALDEVTQVREEVSNALSGLSGLLDGDSSTDASSGPDIVSSRKGTTSGGVQRMGNGGASGRGVAGTNTGYSSSSGSRINSSIASTKPSTNSTAAKPSTHSSGPSARTDASVRKTMTSYAQRFDSIYRRALRSDPTLEGSVILQLNIDPSGAVSSVSVSSSDINDNDFLRKIEVMVRSINFGPAGSIWSGPYTLNFYPQ